MTKELKKVFWVLMVAAGVLITAWPGVSFGGIRTAVVPFEVEYGQGNEVARCRSCGNLINSGPVEGNPAPLLTRLLWDLLQEKEKGEGFDFVSPDQVAGYYNILLSKDIEKDPIQLIKTLGTQMKADYVLWGDVFRYQERIGTSYGVQQPASVAFDLHLMRIKDGKMIWRAQWIKTQKSLTENLLEFGTFVKSKMRWVTAEELSLLGLKEMLKDFPPAESLK